MMKQLFVYRGWRVRPFHRYIKVVTFLVMLLPFLLLMGYYGYLYYEIILQEPIKYGAMTVGSLFIISIMVELLNRYLYLKSTFFGRLDNLRILSTFLIENNFYISQKTGDKQKIKLPKVYVKRDKHGLDATFILQGNKFQDRFLRVSSDLEVMFDGDFIDKVFSKGFVSYTIAFGRIEGRINVKDVLVTDKGVRLMETIYWNFDEQPHLLLSGGTGGGKTVLLMCLIYGLARHGYVDVCDPKKSDFVGLKDIPVFQNRVFFEKEDMIKCLEDNVKFMDKRYEAMTNHPEFTPGKRYSHYGFKPKFIIFDEWAAFIASLDNDYKSFGQVNEYLTQIVLKGRQAGVFIVLGLQRPDGEFIKTALRDNFMKRVSVGHLEDTGYMMMYGDANRNKEFKKIDKINGKKVYGRGYIANGGEIAREFFSPFVPFEDGFSFIDEFSKLPVVPFEGKEFEVFGSPSASISANSDDVIQTDEDDFSSGETLTLLKDFSVQNGFDIKVLRKIIDVLRGLGHEFEKKDGGLYLTAEQEIILTGVVSEYEKGQPSYAKAVEVYFEGENQ